MDDSKEAILYLNEKTDLLACEIKCPHDSHKYYSGVHYVTSTCNKCGLTFKHEFNQDIYTKKARQLNKLLKWNNKVTIIASEKYEGILCEIRDDFIEFDNWAVSEITQAIEEVRVCKQCGVCQDCFTCKKCGTAFTKNSNRRKQFCPKCKSTEFVQTYIKEAKHTDNEHISICPHCNSTNIKFTRTSEKDKCPKCGSTQLSNPYTNVLYSLIIQRKKGYELKK